VVNDKRIEPLWRREGLKVDPSLGLIRWSTITGKKWPLFVGITAAQNRAKGFPLLSGWLLPRSVKATEAEL
jgi:hypothetical protein